MFSRNLMVGISLVAMAAGTASAQSTTNQSTVTQTGTDNQNSVTQQPLDGSATSTIQQNGRFNDAVVFQNGRGNRSVIAQVGTNNDASHRQDGNGNGATSDQLGDDQRSGISQDGDANEVSVRQRGGTGTAATAENSAFSNQSDVTQGTAASTSSTGATTAQQRALRNSVTVRQEGRDQRSTVNQRQSGSDALTNDNRAVVDQLSTGADSRIDQNGSFASATVIQRGFGTISDIIQSGQATSATRNSAFVSMTGGDTGGDPARVTNESLINQVGGSGNFADVTMQGGGNRVAATGELERNFIDLGQNGDNNGFVGVWNGQGNQSIVRQNSGGSGHRAEIFQRGVLDGTVILQGVNGTASGETGGGRATATVSSRGLRGLIQIIQRGTGFVEVTQGFDTADADNFTGVGQRQAGSTSTASSGGATNDNPFGTPTTTTTNTVLNNEVRVAQYGARSEATVLQNAIGSRVFVFQLRGTQSNKVAVDQGIDRQTDTPIGADGSNNNLRVDVTQSGSFNTATINQAGLNQGATVIQAGSGTADNRNSIRIDQSNRDNTAFARQNAGVTASTAEDPDPAGPNGTAPSATPTGTAGSADFQRGTGAQSAEIVIMQSGVGGNATVEQFGRGQFAMINQSGTANSATITQQAAATNAVATITQSGSGNSFMIDQTRPGQFNSVSQTGNNNSSTSSTSR